MASVQTAETSLPTRCAWARGTAQYLENSTWIRRSIPAYPERNSFAFEFHFDHGGFPDLTDSERGTTLACLVQVNWKNPRSNREEIGNEGLFDSDGCIPAHTGRRRSIL